MTMFWPPVDMTDLDDEVSFRVIPTLSLRCRFDDLPVNRPAIADWLKRHSAEAYFGCYISHETEECHDIVNVGGWPSRCIIDHGLDAMRATGKSGTVFVALDVENDETLVVTGVGGLYMPAA